MTRWWCATMDSGAQLADDIAALLAAERSALARGDQETLRAVAETKDKLLTRLQETPLTGPVVARLRGEAARNEALLGAHASGIRAAIRRIGALAQAGAPIASYDGTGARAQIGPDKPEFEHRS